MPTTIGENVFRYRNNYWFVFAIDVQKYWQPFSVYNYRGHDDWELIDSVADSLKNNAVKEDKVRFSVLLERKNASYIVTLVGPVRCLYLCYICVTFVLR